MRLERSSGWRPQMALNTVPQPKNKHKVMIFQIRVYCEENKNKNKNYKRIKLSFKNHGLNSVSLGKI